jgi:hypothetical protein
MQPELVPEPEMRLPPRPIDWRTIAGILVTSLSVVLLAFAVAQLVTTRYWWRASWHAPLRPPALASIPASTGHHTYCRYPRHAHPGEPSRWPGTWIGRPYDGSGP